MKRRTSLTNFEIAGMIRLLCLAAIAASLSGSAAFALDPMGPPRATGEPGLGAGSSSGETDYILDPFQPSLGSTEHVAHYSVGADFSFSKIDLELTNGNWTNPDSDPTSGTLGDVTVKDFETIKLYGTVGYGFTKNWEAFLGFGATKAEFGDELWGSGESFDSGIGFGARGGVRTTIFEIPEYNLQIGGLLQLNWANYDGELDVPQDVQTGPDFVDIDLTEMQIAMGATYLWKEGFSVYGGPFVYYISGDLESSTFEGFDITWDIDAGPIWGAYLGAQYDISRNCVINLEYLHTSDASALGASLIFLY